MYWGLCLLAGKEYLSFFISWLHRNLSRSTAIVGFLLLKVPIFQVLWTFHSAKKNIYQYVAATFLFSCCRVFILAFYFRQYIFLLLQLFLRIFIRLHLFCQLLHAALVTTDYSLILLSFKVFSCISSSFLCMICSLRINFRWYI